MRKGELKEINELPDVVMRMIKEMVEYGEFIEELDHSFYIILPNKNPVQLQLRLQKNREHFWKD